MKEITIIGSGSYGTALAYTFSKTIEKINLVARSEKIVQEINTKHTNFRYAYDKNLPKNITSFINFSQINSPDAIFIVVPGIAVTETIDKLTNIDKNIPIILCTKSINTQNAELFSTYIKQYFKHVLILSGPSFSTEVFGDKLSGVNLACENLQLAQKMSNELKNKHFLIEPIDDIIGAQLFGTLKNILAIGCGIMHYEFPECAGAFSIMITRAICEMKKIVKAYGGVEENFFQLCAIADLFLTCTSVKSRNYTFGQWLCQNKGVQHPGIQLIEGAMSVLAIPKIEEAFCIQLPVYKKIYQIVYGGKCPRELMEVL